MRCPSCQHDNRETARFCDQCGASLSATQPASGWADEGERRRLTVMFCDLVGSTGLSQELDPEELRDVLRHYQSECARIVRAFQGYIAHYIGDGILVYFGYPLAHEDDARRAVSAGLEIVSLPLTTGARAAPAVRAAVHTGLAVLAEMGSGERRERADIVGETPNLAARLQSIAEPGTLVVSADSHELIRGFFECASLEPQTLKGFAKPIQAYRVLQRTEARSRLDANQRQVATLVGREEEMGALLEQWRRAQSGEMQVVIIRGEPGIGKSRLIRALRDETAGDSRGVCELQCSRVWQDTALYPVSEQLSRFLGFSGSIAASERARTIEAVMGSSLATPNAAVVMASLLSVPLPAGNEPLRLSPEALKQKTYEVWMEWLLAEAGKQPLQLIVEDLHWVDPSTLELLTLLLDRARTARLLCVFSCRPEFAAPWPAGDYLTDLSLSRLLRNECRDLAAHVAGDVRLSETMLSQVVDKTDGVPLFVEELTSMIVESGRLQDNADAGDLAPVGIPVTLNESLMARLDQLGEAKPVAQLAAAMGREFSYQLLSTVCPLKPLALAAALDRLLQSGLVYENASSASGVYSFKHALVQDAAYESLLYSTRRRYHGAICQALETRFPEVADSQPELLAHHHELAGDTEAAVRYWAQAGFRAVERSANVEAASHLRRALLQLEELPDADAQKATELDIRMALAPALRAVKGYGSPEVESEFVRAGDLATHLGDTERRLLSVWGLWSFHVLRADLRRSLELAERSIELADGQHMIPAYRAKAATLFWFGRFDEAIQFCDRALAQYDPQRHRPFTLRYGLDNGIASWMFRSWASFFIGAADRALTEMDQALELAQQLEHAFTTGLPWPSPRTSIASAGSPSGR